MQSRSHAEEYLTRDEFEGLVREQTEAYLEEWLADYEAMMADTGGDPADFAAVERLRTEYWRLCEQSIATLMRAKELH